MEEEKIEAIITWPKIKSVNNIQVFLVITNFYQRFINKFSQITILLSSM